jgi:hypothetical protein
MNKFIELLARYGEAVYENNREQIMNRLNLQQYIEDQQNSNKESF